MKTKNKKQVSDKLTDKQVLFFAKAAEIGMTDKEKQDPMSYVNKINYLAYNKVTNVSQVLSIIPHFALALDTLDKEQTYKNLGLK
jgi:hypothetical protein